MTLRREFVSLQGSLVILNRKGEEAEDERENERERDIETDKNLQNIFIFFSIYM